MAVSGRLLSETILSDEGLLDGLPQGVKQSSEQTTICIECSSFVNIVANIEDPAVIREILDHLGMNVTEEGQLPQCCAPTRGVLFA